MSRSFFRYVLLGLVIAGGGCEQPRQQEPNADVEGITLADLKSEQQGPGHSFFSFTMLTYGVDAAAVDKLAEVIDSLSQQHIDYADAEAFEANGFAVGCGGPEEAASIVQKLRALGAVRIGRGVLMTPPGSHEILHAENVIGPSAVIYSTSQSGFGGASLPAGKIGWVISARDDTETAAAGRVSLCPAFWQIGNRTLRLVAGQEPFQFDFFDVGRIHFSMKPREFCLLGPERVVRDQNTLDRFLFQTDAGGKLRFFVIVFEGRRGIDGD